MQNDERLRLGVVGAGVWGGNIVRSCADLGVLAAVCDSSVDRLQEVRARYGGVRTFTDLDAMITSAGLHALAIAVPAQAHAEVALRAIAAGLDVLVEKPLALTVVDAQRVVDAARNSSRKLVVGHVLLYHPAVQRMLQMIGDGEVGDVRQLCSRRLNWGRLRAHEDVWWSFAPHDVAVMLEVMGEEPASATRVGGAYVRPNIADVAYVDFRFPHGRIAHIEVSWLSPERVSRIDVFGSLGVLSFVDSRQGATLTFTPCGNRLDDAGRPELWRSEARDIPVAAGEPLKLEIEAFCRAVQGGDVPLSHGEEGLAVVKALSMAGDAQPEVLFHQ